VAATLYWVPRLLGRASALSGDIAWILRRHAPRSSC
jgi:hypothetical protein